jgi:hypothetical protein
MAKHPKRPRDLNQWAKQMVDLATMDGDDRAALHKKLTTKKPKQTKRHISGKRGSAKPD